jgi:dTDP-4-dehydrorhamnose reductase
MGGIAEPARLEMWGGLECTVNRVWDRYFDQTDWSGHHRRPDDLDRFAELGITALRYPLLWERISPGDPAVRDFRWTDERMGRLRALGIRPIAGLIHHGSGPRHTNLIDDEGFAPGLATHARAIAERYPWVTDWTPVNEPVTTARFACLYGLWYPHRLDEESFWRAVLNQIDATRFAMREIRAVCGSHARLIATDDLGFAHAGDESAEAQAAYENERRWVGWDLMCGRVVPDHPLWQRVAAHGLGDRLRAIADDPCPPQLIGVNHYLSSERLLCRPEACGGAPAGDGAPLSNVSTARSSPERLLGPQTIIEQAWERYRIPVAVTEAHNGCTREEQLRWFERVWRAAERARSGGAQVEAVTAWALLGSYGWDRLVTGTSDRYEPGVFDVRSGRPRPTAMAPLIRALAAGETPPMRRLLAGPGWWERAAAPKRSRFVRDHRLMVTGRTGTLGQRLCHHAELRGLGCLAVGREAIDLGRRETIGPALDAAKPWAVIHTAGLVDIDRAEREPELARRLNTLGAAALAAACAERGLPFVLISTDQVFDGAKGAAYTEDDTPTPLNVYGRTKAEAERLVAEAHPKALIARTAAFFSPHDRWNFAVHLTDALTRGQRFAAAADSFVTPTYVPDLTDALLDLLVDGAGGIWHLVNGTRVSWAEFAQMIAEARGLDAGLIDAVPASSLGWAAPRPADVALGTLRGQLLPSLDDGIERFARHYIAPAERHAVAAE